MTKTLTTGLVLSGGAAKGFAHLGVLQALEESGIKPAFLSGSSAGAIAAVFYADGYSPIEILRLLSSYKLSKFYSLGFSRSGLMKTTGIMRILIRHLRAKNLEDLTIPTWVCLTNMNTGKAEYHNQGQLARLVLASASIPVFFQPVMLNGSLMADGGVIDNLPIAPLIGKADRIIAVNVNPVIEQEVKSTLRSIAERTFVLSLNNQIRCMPHKPDMLIEPPALAHYGYFDLKKAEEIFRIGYDYACGKLK